LIGIRLIDMIRTNMIRLLRMIRLINARGDILRWFIGYIMRLF